jgi:hypothetical protein
MEALQPVIKWHQQGIVPLGKELTADARCQFVHGDFFAAAKSQDGFDPTHKGRRFHAVLLDIDHSPIDLLHPSHADFYQPEGLRSLARHLQDGGVFAQWSDDPPDENFLRLLGAVFAAAEAHIVKFNNPLLEKESASTIYVARGAVTGIEQS